MLLPKSANSVATRSSVPADVPPRQLGSHVGKPGLPTLRECVKIKNLQTLEVRSLGIRSLELRRRKFGSVEAWNCIGGKFGSFEMWEFGIWKFGSLEV